MKRACWVICIVAGALTVASCSASGAECKADADCPNRETCVVGGGLFVSGGHCVPDAVLHPDGDSSLLEDGDLGPNRGDGNGGGFDTRAGSDTSTTSCTPYETETCACTAGVTGTRTCRPDGSGWTACSCSQTDAGDGGSGGDAGMDADSGGGCQPSGDEKCNGVDDDCDGKTDEDLSKDCFSADPSKRKVGICHGGTKYCRNGSWGDCEGEQTPKKEKCGDGMTDSNCNTIPNDGCGCAYMGIMTGECVKAEVNKNGACEAPGSYESTETSCSDLLDNDCDGKTDSSDGDC